MVSRNQKATNPRKRLVAFLFGEVTDYGAGIPHVRIPHDFSIEHEYTWEVERGKYAVLKIDGNETVRLPYNHLLPTRTMRPGVAIGFAGIESESAWDYFRYGICTSP